MSSPVSDATVRTSAAADRELLRQASAGDEDAARRLFREHAPRLYRHVRRVLNGDADVEDVIQQVFMAAFRGAEQFDGRSHVSTWLFGIATRRALDAARARHRRQRWLRVGQAAGFAWLGLGGHGNSIDGLHAARSEAEAVLERLNPEQRTVFLLHDVEGHTFAEISEMTGVGISTLHGRLKAAHRRLEEIVTQGGHHGD